MALFTDGWISSTEDLAAQDSQLAGVASGEGIDVTQKIATVQEEIGIDLTAMLARQERWTQTGLGNIVVTPALRLWHTLRTLETIYGDAYHSQLNDRYAARRDQFRGMALEARERLMEIGIGVAVRPVAKAAMAQATPISAGALAAGTYFVTTAWVNGQGEEGASANAGMVTVTGGGLEITPGGEPQGVVGWNVYAGPDEGSMVLQNPNPIAAGEAWVQAAPLVTSGRRSGAGQAPNYLKPLPRVIPRG